MAEWSSNHWPISRTKLHVTIMPPGFWRYATTVALLLISTTNFPTSLSKKAFKTSWTTFISKTFMCRSFYSRNHTPMAVRSRRWEPQPVIDMLVYGRRERGATWRGTHEATNKTTWWNPETRGPALKDRLQLETSGISAATEECTSERDPEEQRAPDAMWLKSCCHIIVGSEGRRRKLSARPRNLTIQESTSMTLSWIASISISRYWALVVGSRSDFSQLITFPKPWQSWRSCSGWQRMEWNMEFRPKAQRWDQ